MEYVAKKWKCKICEAVIILKRPVGKYPAEAHSKNETDLAALRGMSHMHKETDDTKDD